MKCEQNIKYSNTLLESLGFIIHPEESLFVPTRFIEYLGFVLNSQPMTISLSDVKKEKIKLLCSEILEDECPKIRTIAKLLGKFTSSFPAVQFGKLHYRLLEREKIQALKLSKGNFDKKMKVSSAGKEDIVWWYKNIANVFNFISRGNCEFVLKTDACLMGWGAISNSMSAKGVFTFDECNCHINVLELKAVYFGLKSLCRDLKETHIKILTDNTTAVHDINNMGSCKSVSCDTEVRKIWDWAIERNNFLTATHIPGILNVEADAESEKQRRELNGN